MNSYPNWWNKTITVFNRYEDVQTGIVKWHSHIINNCFWKYQSKLVIGTTPSADVICRIPAQSNYLDRYLWEKLPNDEMPDYVTFGAGDILVYGAISDEIDEYKPGKRSSDLLKKYKTQGYAVIQYVIVNTANSLVGEHYNIRGN